MKKTIAIGLLALAIVTGQSQRSVAGEQQELLNVSFDLSREYYKEFNPLFTDEWKKATGGTIEVKQSHGGSSKQARAVIDGLEGDVVTFNQSSDIAALAKAGLVTTDWKSKFPHNASPYKSITAFVVKKGNPLGIKDWENLIKPGVKIALVNPKTGGNGRYTFLAAYGYALKKFDNSPEKALEFVTKLFANAPVLDTGGRAATATFAQRGLADVLITFEAEVFLIRQEFGSDQFELITPSVSILADFPVAINEKAVEKHGTRKAAEAYLNLLFSPAGQELAAKYFYRPSDAAILEKHKARFPTVTLVDVESTFGGWQKAQQDHFADGGTFDKIYKAK